MHEEGAPETLDFMRNLQGEPGYDKAALHAVESAYLPPLPDNLPDTVDIEMSFDYNVFVDKNVAP